MENKKHNLGFWFKPIRSRWVLPALTILGIVLLCIALTPKTLQNDTFYVITIGDWMVNHGVDFQDHWSWVADFTYTYPHFLFNILIYLVYSIGGFAGVYLVTIGFFIAFGLSVYYIFSKLLKRRHLASALVLILLFLMAQFVTARSQIVTYSLFLWEFYWIIQLLRTGLKRYIVGLAAIAWLVAMVHATIWPFVFVLYLPFIAEIVVARVAKKMPDSVKGLKLKSIIGRVIVKDSKNLKWLLLAMGLSLGVGLLTPSAICYTYYFRIAAGDSQSFINEHAALAPINDSYFLAVVLLLVAVLCFTKVRVRVYQLCLVGGVGLLALMAVRNTSLFYIFALIILGDFCGQILKIGRQDLVLTLQRIMPWRLAYSLVVAVILLVLAGGVIKNRDVSYLDNTIACDGAINYIKTNLAPNGDYSELHLYNFYDYGSYISFRGIPVFIDSRSDLYQSEFSGYDFDVFDDFEKIEDLDNYEELLTKYDVRYLLNWNDSKLSKTLAVDANYQKLYEDDKFVIFKKLNAE